MDRNRNKVIIIPKEANNNSSVFSSSIRDKLSDNFYGNHIDAIRKYMEDNCIPVSSDRYVDLTRVLLTGAVILEFSVFDFISLPFTLDDRQHDLLLSYLNDDDSLKSSSIAVHEINKNGNEHSLNEYSIESESEMESLNTVVDRKWFAYKINQLSKGFTVGVDKFRNKI